MGVFFVKCLLLIDLSETRYVRSEFLGVLMNKSADTYQVDFTKALKKRFGSQGAPFVKNVPSNSCLFIGGPYESSAKN